MLNYRRMPIEIESPEQLGYGNIRCNLTESSFTDFTFGELGVKLDDVVIAYGDHLGHPGLRSLLAEDVGVKPDDVLLTAGAASALFIVSTSLLKSRDRLLVVRPNYATNIETPRAMGIEIDFLDLRFENGWRIDPAELERRITPKTRLVSITVPHNPTGAMLNEGELRACIQACERKGTWLLVDETYREMSFGKVLPVAAALSKKAISVSSLSKTYGLPGIRMGWLITQDQKSMEMFLAAKEQIFICNSLVDEEIAFQFYRKKESFYPKIQAAIRSKFGILKEWFGRQDFLEWVEPSGGCVAYPRIKASVGIDVEKFYSTLNGKYSTHVGPGHWFEMEKSYMRIGYGWPSESILKEGLMNLQKAAQESQR